MEAQAEVFRLGLPVLLHVHCPVSVVVIRVVPTPLAQPSACRDGGATPVECHGLCPVGFTQSVPSGLKVQGSGSPVPFTIPPPVGDRMRFSWGPSLALPAGAEGHSPVMVLWGTLGSPASPGGERGRSGDSARAGAGAAPHPTARSPPFPENVPGGGKLRFSTCVPESAVFANRSFWLWRSRQGLGCPGWAGAKLSSVAGGGFWSTSPVCL